MHHDRVLVVCTANICRSPLAERLLASALADVAADGAPRVASAGTHARPGQPAARGMQRIAAAWGLDLSRHRSQRVDTDLLAAETLVLTMERRHRDVVATLAPAAAARTFTITELDAVVRDGDDPPQGALASRVAAWHATRSRTPLDAPDVEDPFGGTEADYWTCAGQLHELVERLAPVLAPAHNGD